MAHWQLYCTREAIGQNYISVTKLFKTTTILDNEYLRIKLIKVLDKKVIVVKSNVYFSYRLELELNF